MPPSAGEVDSDNLLDRRSGRKRLWFANMSTAVVHNSGVTRDEGDASISDLVDSEASNTRSELAIWCIER